jgi:hypothetical protein
MRYPFGYRIFFSYIHGILISTKTIKVMKTFKDITFKQHKLGKGHIQGLLMLDSGIELSVVAGSGMYSTSKGGARSAVNNAKDVSSFEVMAIDADGEFLGDAKGWQSREDINQLIKTLS